MERHWTIAIAAAIVVSTTGWASAQAPTSTNTFGHNKQPEAQAVTPPGAQGGAGHKVTTPAQANNPGTMSAAQIAEAVRNPKNGMKAVEKAKPGQKVAIVHVNTATKGNQRAAILAAAQDQMDGIRQLRDMIEGMGWLTTKLQSLHVDPTALIGAAREKSGTLVVFTY